MLDHLIVDGYNVLYAWTQDDLSKRQGHRSPEDIIDQQRESFLSELETAAAQRDVRCTVVFDGDALEDLWTSANPHFQVIYSGKGRSADQVIERMVCERPERCGIAVVTNDRTQGNLVLGWGAHCWSSGMLTEWIEGH